MRSIPLVDWLRRRDYSRYIARPGESYIPAAAEGSGLIWD